MCRAQHLFAYSLMQFSAPLHLIVSHKPKFSIKKDSKKGANPFAHLLSLILTAGVWNTLNKISEERNSRHRVNSPSLYSLFFTVVFQTFAVKETRALSSICLCFSIVYIALLFLFYKANIHNFSDSAKMILLFSK